MELGTRRLKAIILSDRHEDEARNGADLERFGRFVRVLEKAGVEAEHRFAPDAEGLRDALAETAPDLVFSASLYCAPPRDGAAPGDRVGTRDGRRPMIHALLDELGLPYVGSGPAALELAIGKAALKARWLAEGVRTPAFFRLGPGEDCDEAAAAAVGYPCIVKPDREGNSRGIDESSVVRDFATLSAKARGTVDRYGSALVERFLGDEGGVREFTVAMIGSGEAALVLPVEIELLGPRKVRLVTNEDKDGHRTAARRVADGGLEAAVAAFARRAFAAAGVRDYSRCDVILAGGELYAIEVNGQPMVPDLWFEACAAGAGLDEEGYLAALVLAALARLRAEGRVPRGAEAAVDAMRELMPPAAFWALSGAGA